ncbi:hypothetical protein SCACP_29480 [Sporomusa carbonis]
MQTKVSGKDVYLSGSLVIDKNDSIEFILDDDRPSMILRIIFKYDQSNNQVITRRRFLSDTEFEIELINYHNSSGVGISPVQLGTIQGTFRLPPKNNWPPWRKLQLQAMSWRSWRRVCKQRSPGFGYSDRDSTNS